MLAGAVIRKRARLVGDEVRFLRSYLGNSGADFAKLIGSDPSTVSRWESDKQPIGHHGAQPMISSARQLGVFERGGVVIDEAGTAIVGQAHHQGGPVILAWDDVLAGARGVGKRDPGVGDDRFDLIACGGAFAPRFIGLASYVQGHADAGGCNRGRCATAHSSVSTSAITAETAARAIQ